MPTQTLMRPRATVTYGTRKYICSDEPLEINHWKKTQTKTPLFCQVSFLFEASKTFFLQITQNVHHQSFAYRDKKKKCLSTTNDGEIIFKSYIGSPITITNNGLYHTRMFMLYKFWHSSCGFIMGSVAKYPLLIELNSQFLHSTQFQLVFIASVL